MTGRPNLWDKARSMWTKRLERAAVCALLCLLPGCSGDEGKDCGPGTVDQGGTCVAANGDAGLGAGGHLGTAGAGVDGGAANGGGGNGAGGGATANRCASVGLHGPEMVEVKGEDGYAFCVDATKVSVTMYEAYLATIPIKEPEDADCRGNSLTSPCPGSGEANPYGYPTGTDLSTMAIHCLDWCDAVEYCAWAGKRLCTGPDSAGPREAVLSCQESESETPRLPLLSCPERAKVGVDCTGTTGVLADRLNLPVEWTADCRREGSLTCCLAAGALGPVGGSPATETCTELYTSCYGKQVTAEYVGIRCCADVP